MSHEKRIIQYLKCKAGWNGTVCYSFGGGVTLPRFESSAN